MVQNGSNWFKLVLTSFNWIKKDIMNQIDYLDQKRSNESDWLFGSNRKKLVQIGLSQIFNKNWIQLEIIDPSKLGHVPHPCPILSLIIFDYWKTWLKLVMLVENLQACLSYFLVFQCPSSTLLPFQMTLAMADPKMELVIPSKLKFGFSEKATKFEIFFVVLLTRASC